MPKRTLTTCYVESADLTEQVQAISPEQACREAIRKGKPLSLGRIMRVSAIGFIGDKRDRNRELNLPEDATEDERKARWPDRVENLLGDVRNGPNTRLGG